MNYQTIKDKDITIFKIKIEDINRHELLKEIDNLRSFLFADKEFNVKSDRLPGLQLNTDFASSTHITNAKQQLYGTSLKIFKQEFPSYNIDVELMSSWVYISTNSNTETVWHDHRTLSKVASLIPTTYTWIYYIQTPDNCVEDEGKICFKQPYDFTKNESNVFKFFPEEGYLYMWDSILSHRPTLNPNSTADRVIIAGNVFLNIK